MIPASVQVEIDRAVECMANGIRADMESVVARAVHDTARECAEICDAYIASDIARAIRARYDIRWSSCQEGER